MLNTRFEDTTLSPPHTKRLSHMYLTGVGESSYSAGI